MTAVTEQAPRDKTQEKGVHAGGRPGEDVHIPFLTASLLLALFGGFALAVSLPIEQLAGPISVSWFAQAQVHGHLQVVGFAGLFVVGMAFRLSPRFGERRVLAWLGATKYVFALLVLGLLARGIGQPLGETAGFAWLAVAGAVAETAGAALFAAILVRTLWPRLRAPLPHAVLLAGAGLGMTLQAALSAWWLAEAAADARSVMRSDQAAVLANLQFFGFLLPAILGVGMRSFPTFFGRPPTGRRAGLAVAVVLIGGVLLWTAGGVIGVLRATRPWAMLDAGQALTGAAILGAIASFGPWRRAGRLAPASKGLAWAIHPAVLWLALTGVLLILTGLRALAESAPTGALTIDAVRHAFAVGVVTLAIVGMAQLILPEFASERLVRGPGAWRGPFFGATISLAALLRGVLPLAGLSATARWQSLAAAGILAWLALAVFAVLLWRARRSHRAYLRRIAAYRANELPVQS